MPELLYMDKVKSKKTLRSVSDTDNDRPDRLFARVAGTGPLWKSHRLITDYGNPLNSNTDGILNNNVEFCSWEGKDCVLKKFPINSDIKNFRRELRILQRLSHPNLIRLEAAFFDTSVQSNHQFVIQLPRYKFGSINDWINGVDEPDMYRLRIVLQGSLRGLAALHGAKVVHCDIKPDNIYVDANDNACVADFDISVDNKTRSTNTFRFSTTHITPISLMTVFGSTT